MLYRSSKTLRELQELIRIISAAGPQYKTGTNLHDLENVNSTETRLYRIIRDSPSITDEALKRDILVNRSRNRLEEETPQSFNKLKSRLKQRLLTTLFSLNLSEAGYSQYSQKLYEVNQIVFLCRVIRALGARSLCISLAEKGLSKALLIEEWSCAMELLFILRAYSSQQGDPKLHRYYSGEYLRCESLLKAEREAEFQWEAIQLAFVRAGEEKPHLAFSIESAAVEVEKLASAFPSFKLSFLASKLRCNASQLRLDYPTALQECEKSFELLDRFPQFSNNARRAEYALMMLHSAVQLQHEQKIEEAVSKCQGYLSRNENNWFVFREYQFLTLMRSLRFERAKEVLADVLVNNRFDTLTEASKEKWALFRLYSEYVNAERVPLKNMDDFRPLLPILSSDKAGLNTEVLILYVLLLASRGGFAELRDRSDLLRTYRKRNLRGAQHSHASHFFQMLTLIASCDLNYKKLVARSSKLRVELSRIESQEPVQGNQILPFSWVWSRILDRLKEYNRNNPLRND